MTYASQSILGCCVGRQSDSDVWYDAEEGGQELNYIFSFRDGAPAYEACALEAGVPEEDANAVAQLASAVDARGVEPLSDPLTLYRFYLARDGNIEEAIHMYRKTIQWRKEFSIGLVMKVHGWGEDYGGDGNRSLTSVADEWKWERRAVTEEARLTIRHGFFGRLKEWAPVDGYAIIVWRLGTADVASLHREHIVEGFMRALVSHLEDNLQALRAASLQRNQLSMCHVVIDVQGLGPSMLRAVGFIRQIMLYCFEYFPESIATVTFVRAHWLCTKIWSLINSRIPTRMQNKFTILGTDFAAGLRAHSSLDLKVLPRFLGGEASNDEVCATEPVPHGAARGLPTPWYAYSFA